MSENPYCVVKSPIVYPEVQELKNGNIKVIDSHRNLEWLLDHFHAEVRYNLMTRKREIDIPGMYLFQDDIENDTLAKVEYLAALNWMPDKNIDKHLASLAGENAYHPIVNHLNFHKKWDGQERLDKFIATIKSANPEFDKILIKTWMVGCIAAAHSEEGFTNHGVLVIQGAQGIGKTEWVKTLDPAQCGAVKVGVLLDPKVKDSVIGANRFWIIELGELDATLNKTDIAHSKSYITSSADDVRVPWGRRETHFVRRTAYVATVNEKNFLVDTTGNRRWWTVSAEEIDYQHGMDMTQVWLEVKHLWENGALTYLPKDMQLSLAESNKKHEKIDPIKEKVLEHYDWDSTARRTLTATTILSEIGYEKPTHGECIRIGKVLSEINGEPGQKNNGLRVHKVPYRYIDQGR